MRVIIKRPGSDAEVLDKPNTYEMLSETVGGYIELLPPTAGLPKNVNCYLNEEGKLKGLLPNITVWDGQDVLCGVIIFTGATRGGNERSLTDKEVAASLQWLSERVVAGVQ